METEIKKKKTHRFQVTYNGRIPLIKLERTLASCIK